MSEGGDVIHLLANVIAKIDGAEIVTPIPFCAPTAKPKSFARFFAETITTMPNRVTCPNCIKLINDIRK